MITINTLGQRIEEVINRTGCKKTEFAEKIGITPAYVSQICSGVRQPSNRILDSICREFKVNEEWLRTEKGDIFREMSVNDEISSFIGNVLTDKSDFRRRLISALARLTPEDWKLIEAKVRELVADEETKNADP